MQQHYFKREQRKGIFHYFRVVGGPGKTKNGYQEVINFLNEDPMISIEENYVTDPSGSTGTWCNFEVGIPITEKEYQVAYKKATSGSFFVNVNGQFINPGDLLKI